MSDAVEPPFEAGETALIVNVPEAEPAVGRWREIHDPAARYGVPAHVTVLVPFLSETQIDPQVIVRLRDLFAAHPPYSIRFDRCARFPGVLYLDPEPSRPFRDLTLAVAREWPEAPPYRGRFDDIIPHLTVTDGAPADVMEAVEAELAAELPVATTASTVTLEIFDGFRWYASTHFALGSQ